MYINYDILKSRGLNLKDLGILQLIRQNKIEDLSTHIEHETKDVNPIEKLSNLTYTELIKGVKGQSEFQRLRITKKGADLLDLINTPDVTDGDMTMYQYLCDLYLQEDSTRSLGNRKAGLRYCAQFRQIMAFSLHEMYWLCYYFVANVEYTKVLEYIFFSKKEHPYGKFKDHIESSKLFLFWEDNEYEIREYWAEKIKN